jgi:cytoskeletal protein RodZ
MSVGSSLQEVRSRSGLTVQQLAARTRIPASVIEDLERDNFATSGGPAYARGHIRTIARICNVDAQALLSQFESQTIPLSKSIRDLLNDTNVTKAKPERKPLSWKALSGIAAGVIAIVVIGTSLFSGSTPNTVTLPSSSNAKKSDGAVAKRTSGVDVTLTAVNGLSWVAVSDSTGAERFSGRIRQGESQSFSDNQLIYLVIGNAGAIRLTVNGEDLGVAGKVGEVVRLEFGPQANSKQG